MGWLDAALRWGSGGPRPAVAVTLSGWLPGVPAAGAGKRGAGLPVICRSGNAARLPRVMIQVLTRNRHARTHLTAPLPSSWLTELVRCRFPAGTALDPVLFRESLDGRPTDCGRRGGSGIRCRRWYRGWSRGGPPRARVRWRVRRPVRAGLLRDFT